MLMRMGAVIRQRQLWMWRTILWQLVAFITHFYRCTFWAVKNYYYREYYIKHIYNLSVKIKLLSDDKINFKLLLMWKFSICLYSFLSFETLLHSTCSLKLALFYYIAIEINRKQFSIISDFLGETDNILSHCINSNLIINHWAFLLRIKITFITIYNRLKKIKITLIKIILKFKIIIRHIQIL